MNYTVIIIVMLSVLIVLMVLAIVRIFRITAHQDIAPLIREEFRDGREERDRQARELREELGRGQKESLDSLIQNLSAVGRIQQQNLENIAKAHREFEKAIRDQQDRFRDSLDKNFKTSLESQKKFFDSIQKMLSDLINSNREETGKIRDRLDQQLRELRQSNENKLEEMRKTVDEKLHSTLEKRLGESFNLVSERLKEVQQGLGEMRNLATGVGDLKRVLTNVKERGTWGELQLKAILEQLLTPDQYSENVQIKPNSRERVEFAIRLPGRGNDPSGVVWLPIDAKFPKESYERLVDASQAGDVDGVKAAQSELISEIIKCASDIKKKYISPPESTDFGIMYLPTEGLYSEVLRQPGLHDRLQNEFRVVPAGPTTLSAILNSLRMGFRTLAIEKRSSEVWQVLSAVKTEFGKFGEVLARVKSQLDTASNTIDKTQVRTRAMERKLKDVETLPEEQAKELLDIGEVELACDDGEDN
ncbi:MAG: DNA recombination protein RmuC [Spirochaetes bacterium]|nr:DNA recombination protein RmuC [Spirochaetota bacterium]